MPNKKLLEKQALKLNEVRMIQEDHPKISAYTLGAMAFTTIGGSYGKLFNPFPEFGFTEIIKDKRSEGGKAERRTRNQDHAEFRSGFNLTRKPKPVPQPVILKDIEIVTIE